MCHYHDFPLRTLFLGILILTANKENLAEAFHIIVKKIHQINLKQKLKVSHLIKVGCVFRQYRDDDHLEDAPHYRSLYLIRF